MLKLLFSIGRFAAGLFTGGNLDSILKTVDRYLDDTATAEQLKADVTKTWIEAQSKLLVGRTWWFQLFFVIPAGLYWSALIWVSAFPFWGWPVQRMPGFAEEVWLGIVSALFIIDGGKSIIARVTK